MRLFRSLVVGLGLLLAPLAWGQQVPFELDIQQFCGIKDDLPTTKIAPCYSPDAQNVLTEDGRLKTIPGMSAVLQEALAGYAVKGLWYFRNNDGDKYLLIHSSASILQTDLSATPAILKNVSASADVDVAVGFSKAVFVNFSETSWSWDGTSTAAVTNMPLSELVEFADERFYIANTTTSASEVHVSSFGSLTYWTVPSDVSRQPEAPNRFNFDKDNGCAITCLKSTPWGMFVGKTCSTHILKGVDNDTYAKRRISPEIGCIDDRLVQMTDTHLIWLSKDGFYAWNNSGQPELISKDIDNRVASIRQIITQSDESSITSQADWEDATFSTVAFSTSREVGFLSSSQSVVTDDLGSQFGDGIQVNVTTRGYSGDVIIYQGSTATFINAGAESSGSENFVNWDNMGAGANAWGQNGAGCFGGAAFVNNNTQASDPCGSVSFVIVSTAGVGLSTTTISVTDGVGCTHGNISLLDLGASMVKVQVRESVRGTIAVSSPFIIGNSLNVSAGDGNLGGGGSCSMQFDISETVSWAASGTFTSQLHDSLKTSPRYGPFDVAMTSSAASAITFRTQAAGVGDGSAMSAMTAQTPGLIFAGAARRYPRYEAAFTMQAATNTPAAISVVSLAAETTGHWRSDEFLLSTDMTTFGLFTTVQEVSGSNAAIAYCIRTATTVGNAASNGGGCVSVTPGNTITASTGAYVIVEATFTFHSATDTVKIDKITINWNEGESPRGASVYFDRMAIFCVAIEVGSTKNDSCEIIQRNKFWTRMVGKSISALAIYDRLPYAADGSTGSRIWQILDEDSTNFDGTAIDAYWVTPELTMGQPHSDKILREAWIDADYASGNSVDVAYSVNKSTTYVTESLTLDSTSDYLNKDVPIDEGFAKGRYLKLRVRGADLDEPFSLNSIFIGGTVEPRIGD